MRDSDEQNRVANRPTLLAPSTRAIGRPGALFGSPPLIQGEDVAAYNEFHARVSAAVKPQDFLEEIWVRDVVDLSWEILRVRRLKAKLLTSALYRSSNTH